jgi:hypothetical protein
LIIAISVPAIARTDAAPSADSVLPVRSAPRQVLAACSHSPRMPVPAVQASEWCPASKVPSRSLPDRG